jgi:hypothetical protein
LAHARKLVPGNKSVKHQLLVEEDKNLLPPLHIIFGLMRNFVKTMNKHGKGFENVTEEFPETH